MNLIDLFSHHDTAINLRMDCLIISVIYNIVYFAVPSQVEDLFLEPGSHNITVNWNKPINDSYCVTQYVIYWEHALSGSKDTSVVSSDAYSYVIEDLDACAEYEVSVMAVNEADERTDAVTGKTRTETFGNYHAQIILLYLSCGCAKIKGNCDFMSVRLDR